MQGGIERHGRASRRHYAEKHCHPARMVVPQNDNPCAGAKSVLAQPQADGLGHMAQLSVGTALYALAALDFEGHILGPVLDALAKTVVKSRHRSRGKMT